MLDSIRERFDRWDPRGQGLGAFFDAFAALFALVSLGPRDIWTPLDALIRGYMLRSAMDGSC